MTLKGITFQRDKNICICYIDELSEELKTLIKEELTFICHGRNLVDTDQSNYYSYRDTIKDFLVRYNKKTEETKKGMIAEFITHLLIKNFFTDIQTISRFFNKEETSIKKGFDLTYLSIDGSSVWYGEVKSGELNSSQNPDSKSKDLLNKSKNDIKEKLSGKRKTLWDNAILDAATTIGSENVYSIQNLLRADFKEAEVGVKKNAILVSVLFHDVNSKFSKKNIEEHFHKINSEKLFSNLMLFSIQKSTYSKIENFLNQESSI